MAETTATQQQYPNLNPYSSSNGNGSVEGTNNSVMNSKYPSSSSSNPSQPNNTILTSLPTAAQQTMDSVKNSQTVQSLNSGPMADKARTEATTTKDEFSNLASTRSTPNIQTANGQTLTHYHSFFYNLLSWENPRATAISYVSILIFIIATRYVPLVRYILKATYMVLGITAAAEIAGRVVLGEGFATKMRPKRYYTIPRETLESMMEDLTELGNFFVIEFQRIVFAENVSVTIGAFTTALTTYFLIKITPPWGLALLFTTLAYFVPLAYISNQEFIDQHLNNAQDILSKQATQVRDLASEHTNKAMEASSSALKDYSSKAQEMIGGAKKAAVDKGYVSEETAKKVPGGEAAVAGEVKKEDFPAAPNTEPAPATATGVHDEASDVKEEEKEPLLA